MNTFNRIASCSIITALLGISGCIIPPGAMHHDDQHDHDRDNQHESHRDDHHGDNDGRDHADCDQHKEHCAEY